jgi:hypothetical protein
MFSATGHAHPTGSGTCLADANSEFMAWKSHHPGETGDFQMEFSVAGYRPGEPLTVLVSHQDTEQFVGFVLYAEDAGGLRVGQFATGFGWTDVGNLDGTCAGQGHTITHAGAIPRDTLSVEWTPPVADSGPLLFKALILRSDPEADPDKPRGTDFYELREILPTAVDEVFFDGFEAPL